MLNNPDLIAALTPRYAPLGSSAAPRHGRPPRRRRALRRRLAAVIMRVLPWLASRFGA